MAKILIGIDGTGDFFNEIYNKEMEESFVRRIVNNSRIGIKHYLRGPSKLGFESSFVGINGFLKYLSGLQLSDKKEPLEIFITGYSRGAMIAVYLANRIDQYNSLNKFGSDVSNFVKRSFGFEGEKSAEISISMILFDAVDSDLTMYGPGIFLIPKSVRKVCHFVCADSSALLPRSRWYFDRIDLKSIHGLDIEVRRFMCTHAAIGGLPGKGDHRIPTSRAELLATGVNKLLQVSPNPALTGITALHAIAGQAYDSIRSNVTLEQDIQIYEKVRRAVANRVAQEWEVAKL